MSREWLPRKRSQSTTSHTAASFQVVTLVLLDPPTASPVEPDVLYCACRAAAFSVSCLNAGRSGQQRHLELDKPFHHLGAACEGIAVLQAEIRAHRRGQITRIVREPVLAILQHQTRPTADLHPILPTARPLIDAATTSWRMMLCSVSEPNA